MAIIEPIGKRIVAKLIKNEETKSQGGLIIQTQVEQPSNVAEVLFVGKAVEGIFSGDKIIMMSHAPFSFAGENLITLLESDVLGRVK